MQCFIALRLKNKSIIKVIYFSAVKGDEYYVKEK